MTARVGRAITAEHAVVATGQAVVATEPAAAAGRVVAAAGPVVRAAGLAGMTVGEVARVGPHRLFGEVIRLQPDAATIQVYEETEGLRVGDAVERSHGPLSALLGPGLLGTTFDGLQRPLSALVDAGSARIAPGLEASPLDRARRWPFVPTRAAGEMVGPGDVVGTVAEGPFEHRILVPPDTTAGRLTAIHAGDATIDDEIGRLAGPDGEVVLRLAHAWPVRRLRPVARRLGVSEPLATGQRVLDMLFPVARGGTAVIPGGFGTGKTVVEQSLARWADADVVVFVGCGERGNEMAAVLGEFAELVDPRTGGPLLARSVLIANTSNMPVAAREAAVQLGATIAEYFRDQGYVVALLADSTSRWAEAMREIGGRLEELPGEEGFPAYLGSRLAHFYERSGRVAPLGQPERTGSLTIVGAVSPPGGDFSEPVTQASLRLAGTFWALDAELAHARHFPAIGWTDSYSLYVGPLTPWYRAHIASDWDDRRTEALALLARERELNEIVQLVGPDALPEDDRVALAAARLLREVFLQQHAFDPVDAARPAAAQFAMLRATLAAGPGLLAAVEGGTTLAEALESPLIEELRRSKAWTGDDLEPRLADLAARLARWQVPG
jgi:V/A-type H+-transporting ATPase subunit A